MTKAYSFAFPTPEKLFRRRLLSHWREQISIIRIAADWTVLLYFIIPGGLLGGRFYYGFWNGELPGWFSSLPFLLLPAVLSILISTGGMVLLLQEGDLMFLRQRQSWINTLMLRGILYSLVVTTVKITAVYALLLPFIIRGYGFTVPAAISLLILTLTCSWCVKLLGHNVRVQRQGWRRWLWQIPAIALPCGIFIRVASLWSSHPALLWLLAAIFAAAALAAIRYRLALRGTFMNDVREDYKQRMRIAGLMLRGVLDKPRPTRYKPWIFRKSQPLLSSRLPESRLSAAAIKALVRNPGHLKLYLIFTGVSLIAVLIVPGGWKWLVLIVLCSLLTYWLSSFLSVFMGDDYIGILPFSKNQKQEAGARSLPLMIAPFAICGSAAVCIANYGWWGLPLFIPLGIAVGFMVSRVFSVLRFGR